MASSLALVEKQTMGRADEAVTKDEGRIKDGRPDERRTGR